VAHAGVRRGEEAGASLAALLWAVAGAQVPLQTWRMRGWPSTWRRATRTGCVISSVASCQNLWAIIMDAGTSFTAQVYELSHMLPAQGKPRPPAPAPLNARPCCSPPQWVCFLSGCVPAVGVSPEWVFWACWRWLCAVGWGRSGSWSSGEKRLLHSSAIAGSSNGNSLVVMSKGEASSVGARAAWHGQGKGTGEGHLQGP